MTEEIKITVEGGVIQAISGIPKGCKVTVFDFDTDGVPSNELTMVDEEEAVVSTWNGPVEHEDRAIDLETLKEFMISRDTLNCYIDLGSNARSIHTIIKPGPDSKDVVVLNGVDGINDEEPYESLDEMVKLHGRIRNGLQDNKFFIPGYELEGY